MELLIVSFTVGMKESVSKKSKYLVNLFKSKIS